MDENIEFAAEAIKNKTFSEEALDMLLSHPDSELILYRGPWGELQLQMRDRSKDGIPIGAKQVLMHELYEKSNLSADEVMSVALQRLRKELDKYGCEP